MKTSSIRRWKAGYVSTLLVLATGSVLTLLTVYAYRRATGAMATQSKVQLRVDYSEKEEAILRSIVAITPNRAMRAMFSQSDANAGTREPLRWQNIFTEALTLANARTSISGDLAASLQITNLNTGNAGDSSLVDPARIFAAVAPDAGYVSRGINRSLGNGYPPPLSSVDTATSNADALYPIISTKKTYGTLAQAGVGLPVGTYPNFNLLKYPQINFGYAKPGEDFVAKRNWWAFSVDVADHDDNLTFLARQKRNFVLSIYEIPSQLAISASSFMSLGQFGAGGGAWQNVTIEGGIFAGKAEVLPSDTEYDMLSSRRSMSITDGTVVGERSFTSNPFKAGDREDYQVEKKWADGTFFPVSQASESGRVAFIPINRSAEFFDRFVHGAETQVLSSTSWDNYSVGALQCAMKLDVTKVVNSANPQDLTPTELRFEYKKADGTTVTDKWPLVDKAILLNRPSGYVLRGPQTGYPTPQASDQVFNFTEPTDLAYGLEGVGYSFILNHVGPIRFNNDTFGNPAPNQSKFGYSRPSSPFQRATLPSGKICIKVLPQRIPGFLNTLGAANASINNSLVVNLDYRNIGPTYPLKPNIPCADSDIGLILKECADLTGFTKGFSLVTNLRLYFGDDFNTIPATPPAGYTPTGTFYPPCSIFAPEKRYGVDVDPFSVVLGGQVGSLASDTVTTAIRPLDAKNRSGTAFASDKITVNLRPIVHPAALPPITMMNWLVVLEERRREFY